MRFNYYRLIYFNLILIMLFLLNQFMLFLLVFFFKIPYILNSESDIEYEFNFQTSTFEDVGSAFLENDIDNDFYYTLQHMQSYLYSNCRFFFDVLGGETTLDYIDFIDFTIYKINDTKVYNINRNYKYIYNNDIGLKNLNYYNNFKFFLIKDDLKINYYSNKYVTYIDDIITSKREQEKPTNILKYASDIKLSLYSQQIKIQKIIGNKQKEKKKELYMIEEPLLKKVKYKIRRDFLWKKKS